MSECLRLIVYFLWHYDTAAVTFHSSFVRPTFSAFSKLIYICNQLKCGGEKRKRWRNQNKCEQQVLFVASNILHWRVFFIFFRSSSFTFCIASADKHFPALDNITPWKKDLKRKFLISFYPILIFLIWRRSISYQYLELWIQRKYLILIYSWNIL